MTLYLVEVCALSRENPSARNSFHAAYEIEAPRMSLAVKGCFHAFAQVRVRELPKGRCFVPHLHGIKRIYSNGADCDL